MHSHFDLSVTLEEVSGKLGDWFKLFHSERLQLLLEGCSQRPPSVDISWREPVGPRRVIHDEFDNVVKFAYFVWKTLHDILHQHSHDLLCLKVP